LAFLVGLGDASRLPLASFPPFVAARALLAALFFGLVFFFLALLVLSEGVVVSPCAFVWRVLLATLLVPARRFVEVLNLMPDSLAAFALADGRAACLFLVGASALSFYLSELAFSAFSAMTSLPPYLLQWWLALGVYYVALADVRLAISSCSRALALGGLSSASARYANSRLTDFQEQP
jgi:hypothetical protein